MKHTPADCCDCVWLVLFLPYYESYNSNNNTRVIVVLAYLYYELQYIHLYVLLC